MHAMIDMKDLTLGYRKEKILKHFNLKCAFYIRYA